MTNGLTFKKVTGSIKQRRLTIQTVAILTECILLIPDIKDSAVETVVSYLIKENKNNISFFMLLSERSKKQWAKLKVTDIQSSFLSAQRNLFLGAYQIFCLARLRHVAELQGVSENI